MKNDLLCFKLCYCYGVSEVILRERFPDAMEIADELSYFKDKKATNELRALYRVIFLTIRHMDKVKDNWSLDRLLNPKEAAAITSTGLDLDGMYANVNSLDSAISMWIVMANSKLPKVHEELEVNLPFALFEMLTSIRQFTLQELPAVQYMLKRQPFTYNIYFSNSEILNVSVYETLCSDTAILKKLRVLCGDEDLRDYSDDSVLGKRLKSSKDRLFMRAAELSVFETLVLDTSSVPPVICQDAVSALTPEVEVISTNSVLDLDPQVLASKGTAVMTRDRDILSAKIGNVLLPLALPRGLYRRVLKGAFPNARLYACPFSRGQ